MLSHGTLSLITLWSCGHRIVSLGDRMLAKTARVTSCVVGLYTRRIRRRLHCLESIQNRVVCLTLVSLVSHLDLLGWDCHTLQHILDLILCVAVTSHKTLQWLRVCRILQDGRSICIWTRHVHIHITIERCSCFVDGVKSFGSFALGRRVICVVLVQSFIAVDRSARWGESVLM